MNSLFLISFPVAFSLVSLAAGGLASSNPLMAAAVFLPAGVWVFSLRRHWEPGMGIGLALVVVLAGLGMWTRMPVWAAYGAVLAGLLGWDIYGLQVRAGYAVDDDARWAFVRRHLVRLGLWLAASLGLGAFSLLGHVRFSFNQAFLLIVLILAGIGLMVSWLRKRGKSTSV